MPSVGGRAAAFGALWPVFVALSGGCDGFLDVSDRMSGQVFVDLADKHR
jgi:hypothetical protein